MNKAISAILCVFFCLSSCSVLHVGSNLNTDPALVESIDEYCYKQDDYKSLYISKIVSSFVFDGENYDARISIYHIPDSVIYFTAINTGFEIMRGAVFPDSIFIINRLEKMVYINKFQNLNQESTITFKDLELLFNRNALCNISENLNIADSLIIHDYSTQNVTRKIAWTSDLFTLANFQFFHKKTGEYVLGEFLADKSVKIYSDYVLGVIEVTANQGVKEYNKELSVNLSANRAKYSYFYLQ